MGPFQGSTLLELVGRQARDDPSSEAFRFGGRPVRRAALWERAGRFARRLLGLGLARAEPVALALSNGPDFFTAFYGVQRAGGVPVPLAPESGLERLAGVAALAGARLLILDEVHDAPCADRCRRLLGPGGRIVRVRERGGPTFRGRLPAVEPGDLCFIQYTSGSTGDPKGVEVTHSNCVANLGSLTLGMGITPREVFVSWLPLHHDMGLILMSMVPFALGARLVLLPSRISTVQPWLEAIAAHRGTFTAAPDFSYRFCARHCRNPRRHDLSSLRVALDAAEPVRARTIEDFERLFGLTNVVMPGYGLAEATVGVSMWPPGRPVSADGRGRVSVGPPFPGVEVRIRAGAGGATAEREGEIEVGGEAATRGYWRNEPATGRLRTADGFVRTGDLGYLEGGNLTITGRCKETIVQAGRSIAPQEIEEAVDGLPFVRRSAAVGVDRGGLEGELAHVFAELRPAGAREARADELAAAVAAAFLDRFGFRPGRVLLLRPRGIPRTANGKLRRGELRRRLLDGSLRREGLVVYPPAREG